MPAMLVALQRATSARVSDSLLLFGRYLMITYEKVILSETLGALTPSQASRPILILLVGMQLSVRCPDISHHGVAGPPYHSLSRPPAFSALYRSAPLSAGGSCRWGWDLFRRMSSPSDNHQS